MKKTLLTLLILSLALTGCIFAPGDGFREGGGGRDHGDSHGNWGR
jgi:hypothetical protein